MLHGGSMQTNRTDGAMAYGHALCFILIANTKCMKKAASWCLHRASYKGTACPGWSLLCPRPKRVNAFPDSLCLIVLPCTMRLNHVCFVHLLRCSKEFGQRLPSNIGLLLRKLWVVMCFHSRLLMICKHGLFTANGWAKRPWKMPDTRMFTNSIASVLESDNNSQHSQ